MHVQVLQIRLVGLSIVMRTESRETLIVEIGLNWVDAANEDVETGVEFLLVYQERIIDVPLNLEFVMESNFWQFREFLDQHYTLSNTAFRRFRDKFLAIFGRGITSDEARNHLTEMSSLGKRNKSSMNL